MSVIYLDMDGVLADFFGGIEALYNVDHWKSIKDKEKIFVDLRNTNFFDTLKPFPTTFKLAERVKLAAWENEIRWGINSSPLRGDTFNSAYWKRIWLDRMGLLPTDLDDLVFTNHKHKFTNDPVDRRPNILIDDNPENIDNFRLAGGIGIRYQANQDDLKEYLFIELEKALDVVNATPKSSV